MTERKDGGMVKSAGYMMAIMLIGKVLGIIREMLNGYVFGTSSVEGTAFRLASLIPRQFLEIMFASAISACFIPVFNTYLEKDGKEAAYKLAYSFVSLITLLTSLVTAVCIIFSPAIVNAMAAGILPETEMLAVKLIRIMFPILILSGAAFSFTGILQSFGEFKIPAAMSVVSNIIIILYYIFLMDVFGIYGLCAAYLIGWGSQAAIQIPFLIKNGFKFKISFNFNSHGIKEIYRLMLPVMISTWAAPVNILVNTRAAANLYGGSGDAINALDYANTLYTVVTGVFVLSIANVIFPRLSRQSAGGDDAGFSATLTSAIRILFFLLIPMTLGLMALGIPLVRLLYERGEFGEFSTYVTGRALFYYSSGIIGFGLQTVLSRAFYSEKNGKIPLLTGVLSIIINFILSFVLVNYLDVGGPALASSVSISAVSLVMLFMVCKKHKAVLDRKALSDILKMAIAGMVMLASVLFIRDTVAELSSVDIVVVAVSVLTGIVTYMAASYLLRINEAREVFAFIVSNIKK